MENKFDRVLKIAEKVSQAAERRIRKELNALIKSGLVSRKEAKQLLKVALKEADEERHRIKKFIKAELRSELKKLKPLVKKILTRKKKQVFEYRKRRH